MIMGCILLFFAQGGHFIKRLADLGVQKLIVRAIARGLKKQMIVVIMEFF